MIDIQLSDQPLDPQTCIERVSDHQSGGIAIFIGTVREFTRGKRVVRLDFEAYQPMAISEMRKIAEMAAEHWVAEKVAIHHRIGSLKVGDIAVVIGVSTPHRKAAFEACEYCIDSLKKTVPIWKKEIFEDGEEWVAAHP